eukprot:TRINITY_DN25745_c0_g1_i1.p1 TRINITY_DN25745_c0_g1~~TRINITY_DN25745_c0_g1_i1.p1  ORF type:complete len:101 (-),score=28.55 TRINITY_DN25745_c0_g1_i1:232-534(-)
MHNGKTNTCIIIDKNGKRFELLLDPEKIPKYKISACFLGRKEVLDKIKEEGYGMAVVLKVSLEQQLKECPMEVKDVLKSFSDIFVKDLPFGLPLVKSTKH